MSKPFDYDSGSEMTSDEDYQTSAPRVKATTEKEPSASTKGKDGTKPKRVRISKACDLCSQRKVRCDGLLPSCTRCFTNNLSCAYSRTSKKRGPAPGSVVSLQKRLKRLEELLEKATQGDSMLDQGEYLQELKEMQANGTLKSLGPAAQGMAEKILGDSRPAKRVKTELVQPLPAASIPNFTFPDPNDIMEQIKQVQMQHLQGIQQLQVNNFVPDPMITLQLQQIQQMQQPPRFGVDALDSVFGRGRDFEEPVGLLEPETELPSFEPSPATEDSPAEFDLFSLGLINPWGESNELELIPASEPVKPIPASVDPFPDLPPLPDQALLDHLLQLYFEVIPKMSFGNDFIHKNTFFKTTQPPLLLYSMYAVAIPFLDSRTCVRYGLTPDAQDKGKLASGMFERAKRALYSAMDTPTLPLLQALLNLVIHGVSSWTLGAIAYQFTGMAVTMARQMKCNWEPFSDRFQRMVERASGSKPVRPMSSVEAETRRRIWWSLYNLDRCTAVAADRSCLISDNECLISLPCSQSAWETDNLSRNRQQDCPPAPASTSLVPSNAAASSDVMSTQLQVLSKQWQSLSVNNLPACLAMVLSANGEEVNAVAEMLPKLQDQPKKIVEEPTSANVVQALARHRSGQIQVVDNVAVYQAMLNNVVGKIVEFHQWCSFRDLNPFNPPGTELGDAATQKLNMVDNMLKRWWEMIPIAMKHGYDPEISKMADLKSSLPYLHLFYHTSVILLHCPRDTNLMRLEKDVSWLSGESFLRCSEEATIIADLLELLMEESPNLDHADPYVAFCIFQTGLIHLVGIKNLQQQMILACGSPDCGADELVELVNEAKRQLDCHIRSLAILGKRWMTADRLCQIISKLVEDVQAPLVTGFGLLVSEDKEGGGGRFWTLKGMEAPSDSSLV